MFRLQVKDHFDAAHKLAHYEGKCNRLHGHRWDIEVVVEGETLSSPGNMLLDFSVIKGMMKKIINTYLDHYYLNEQLQSKDITAEFLAKWFYERMQRDLNGLVGEQSLGIHLARVTVWESPDCCVKYSPTMNPTGVRHED